MTISEFFSFIKNQIHTTVFATIDKNGLPHTCVIDIMLCDENSLYFITARGKDFYERLKRQSYVSFSAAKGNDTLSSIAVTVCGKVQEINSSELLNQVFLENPYMENIYPSDASRAALCVFQIYEGEGEYFDLSKLPVERYRFVFGNAKTTGSEYNVTNKCTGCKLCYSVCPQKCIDIRTKPVAILQKHCLHCGNCIKVCPNWAIEKRALV